MRQMQHCEATTIQFSNHRRRIAAVCAYSNDGSVIASGDKAMYVI